MMLILQGSITTLIFAIGLTATAEDVAYLWQRPSLLGRSVIAMYVVIPVIAVLMGRVLDLPRPTELALVVLAVCAGAPLLPKKLIQAGGNPAYVFSLIVTTSLVAIVTVPVSLHLIGGYVNFDASAVTPEGVARVIFVSLLLPLAAGMLIRRLAPALAARIGDPLLRGAGLVMAVCAVVALIAGFHLILDVGWPSVLAFGLFTLLAIATGHLLGGPEPSDRTSLAVACASRHIGLALLVAANARREQTLALVVAYLLASAGVSIPYISWRTRHVGAAGGTAAGTGPGGARRAAAGGGPERR